MSTIGELVLRQDGSGAAGYWKAHTFKHAFSGTLYENEGGGDDAPTLRLFAKAPHGTQVEIGVAWEKVIQNGPRRDERFYSIQLNHPEIFPDKPLNLAAFAMEGSAGTYEIILSRPRAGQQSDAQAA